jgi:hypothetical protein
MGAGGTRYSGTTTQDRSPSQTPSFFAAPQAGSGRRRPAPASGSGIRLRHPAPASGSDIRLRHPAPGAGSGSGSGVRFRCPVPASGSGVRLRRPSPASRRGRPQLSRGLHLLDNTSEKKKKKEVSVQGGCPIPPRPEKARFFGAHPQSSRFAPLQGKLPYRHQAPFRSDLTPERLQKEKREPSGLWEMWATAKRLSKGWGQARLSCGQHARPVTGASLAPGVRLSTGNRRGRIGLVPSPAFSTALPGLDYGCRRRVGHRASRTGSDADSWGRLHLRRRFPGRLKHRSLWTS